MAHLLRAVFQAAGRCRVRAGAFFVMYGTVVVCLTMLLAVPGHAQQNKLPGQHLQLPYDSAWAVAYAMKYWGQSKYARQDARYFPRYPNGNNCANFINQCLLAGLAASNHMPAVRASADTLHHMPGWYYRSYEERARAWSVVHDMYLYASTNTGQQGWQFNYLTRDYPSKSRPNIFMDVTILQKGDIVFMDYEHDGHFDHVMLVTDILHDGKYYADIRLTGHTEHWRNKSLLAIKQKYNYNITFFVFRPVGFRLQ